MKRKALNNIKLGIFVITGSIILIISLYLIGQNQHFFGSSTVLKVRFRNVGGLMPGNNVRFSGIQCGTVKDIEIINDTTIEVSMLISRKTISYIRSNAAASIGTEGLMGNKVINITPGSGSGVLLADGDMLGTTREKGVDEILQTLNTTGDNAQDISMDLKETAKRLNNSILVRELFDDTIIAADLRNTMQNFRDASTDIRIAATAVKEMAVQTSEGKSAAGILLADRHAANQVAEAINHLDHAAAKAGEMVTGLDSLVTDIHVDIREGRGIAHLLTRDSIPTKQLQNSLQHIEQGTKAFNEDMEALKHNFLLRGYFRRQERIKKNRR